MNRQIFVLLRHLSTNEKCMIAASPSKPKIQSMAERLKKKCGDTGSFYTIETLYENPFENQGIDIKSSERFMFTYRTFRNNNGRWSYGTRAISVVTLERWDNLDDYHMSILFMGKRGGTMSLTVYAPNLDDAMDKVKRWMETEVFQNMFQMKMEQKFRLMNEVFDHDD